MFWHFCVLPVGNKGHPCQTQGWNALEASRAVFAQTPYSSPTRTPIAMMTLNFLSSDDISILKRLCSSKEWKVLFLVKMSVSWWKGLGNEMLQWVDVPHGLLGCCWGLADYIQGRPEPYFPFLPVLRIWSVLPAPQLSPSISRADILVLQHICTPPFLYWFKIAYIHFLVSDILEWIRMNHLSLKYSCVVKSTYSIGFGL